MYKNYNINQLVLPLNLEIKIQDNDIARHVNNLVESIPKKAFDKYYKEKAIGDIKASHILIKSEATSDMTDDEKKKAEEK